LRDAGTELPLFDRGVSQTLTQAGEKAEAADLPGALGGLGVFVALSSFVFLRRLRPE